MEYYIKRINVAPSTFSVSKFDGNSEQPLEVYRVFEVMHPGGAVTNGRCECMSWRSGKKRPCKHQSMVEEFKAAGEPQPFIYQP